MNTFKKTGGFTLVELIIVIAILAILSSVAVAGYSTYITKANTSAVKSELSNISTAAVLANAEKGDIDGIEVTFADGKMTITVKDTDFAKNFKSDFAVTLGKTAADVKDVEGGVQLELTTKANWNASDFGGKTAEWTNNEWTAK